MKVSPVLLLLLLGHVDKWGPLVTWGTPVRHLGGLLYPFGPEVGDESTPRTDDGMSPKIVLWETFSFYSQPHHSLYVNNNGVVSFGTGVPEFTPEPFPLPGHRPFVAPYWADVDTSLGGEVFYRQSRDLKLLAQLTQDLALAVTPLEPAPKPTWAFVATWHRVSYFGAASNKVNTFQAVLATDGVTSFVVLNYGDLQWTTGISNQGDPHTGLGGLPAQAGFNSGDDVHYYNIPGSRSPAVLGIARSSNVGVPGRWIFRVDKFTATEAPPSTPSTVPTPRSTTKEKVYICEWVKGHKMVWGTLGVLLLLGVLSLVRGTPLPPEDASSPFQYDWHQLRVAGLVVAAVLCVAGFVVLFSGKCKCRSKASRRCPPPEMSHLVGPGASSTC